MFQVLFVYNITISLVNVVCFVGFAYCLFYRAESIYSKKFDPVLSDIYFLYWITKVCFMWQKILSWCENVIQFLVDFCTYIITFILVLGGGASWHRVYGCQKTISTNFTASCLPSFLNAIVIRMWIHKILMASICHGPYAQFISPCCTVSILRAHWHRY